MDFFRKHKLIAATIAIQIIALPLILLVVKQKQNTQSNAAQATTLYFNPQTTTTNPLSKNLNDDIPMDVMVDPGGINAVSLVKLEINYDPTKLSISDPSQIIVNSSSFPTTVEGPVLSNGKIQIVVTVGGDYLKVIQAPTKVITINFKAIGSVDSTQIGFGPSSEIRSTSGDGTYSDNVLSLSTSTPAYIKIAAAPTLTPTPTNAPTSTPTPLPTNTPTPTPTPKPTSTPTPLPTNTPTPTPTPIIQQITNTPTPTLASTVINLTNVKLHGLGKGGDSPNPTGQGNLNPLRTNRSFTIELLDKNEVLVNTFSGNFAYTGSSNGLFNGSITLPNTVLGTDYIVKVKTPYFLRRKTLGFLSLKIGETNNIDSIEIVAGDVNNDNKLDSTDYNLIMECYSDLQAAKPTCTSVKKLAADITDDGKVNANDYNLFLRELSVQNGD